MADMRWLERRGMTWYAVMDVPRPLQAIVGKQRFKKSLRTRDLHVAISRRYAALAEFRRAIDVAGKLPTAAGDTVLQEALGYRETLQAIDSGDQAFIRGFHAPGLEGQETMTRQEVAREITMDALDERVAHLRYLEGRAEDAEKLASVALGVATPLLTYVDDWLREGGAKGPVKPRTAKQYRADLRALEDWLGRNGVPLLIERVTKAVAGRWVTGMVSNGEHRKTINRRISAVSSYWRWLGKRTAIEINPWAGQSMAKGARPGEAKSKRPYEDHEVRSLLDGDCGPELHDLIRVAALTGMRIEEIYRLRVKDCAEGWFDIADAKTRAGVRRIPIHTGLTEIIEKRMAGKGPVDFLFHEAGPAAVPGRERSMPASKRFGRYKRSLGINDRPEGSRQDCADFHSLRRWFVTKARRAGIDLAVLQGVIGHEAGNITDDVYSGGASDDQKRACVEAVRLPSGDQSIER